MKVIASAPVKVIAGCPTYDGTRYNAASLMQLHAAGAQVREVTLSLLTRAFNECYVYALNAGATHFLMLHADVLPIVRDWPQVLVALMEVNGAGILSVVLPIKTASGLTSTAIETADPWNPTRLSLADVAERAETWTEPGLLVNTGLMLVDLRQSWATKVCFTMHDRIRQNDAGIWVSECQPEDWAFSRQVREAGGSVWATRAIRALHFGTDSWPNDSVLPKANAVG